ncbi:MULTISPECIES: CaiB/BaiF CoA-transferase family protein [unclassified Methylobacterium]|uniref:CaiB/BaiF CoA transferase family protein n=1 Tax=unclassified Methylobacterium TaxID=2615210 RepID=UPI0011C1E4B2|nr:MULTISPECIES: CaiB/BaiF CoA-transferase family protein [unclassified Methylobacterium]QEE40084.1 CoA transferase [Methylobacterium sp. WL1]TXN58324.1 CoA transferase [Methylobacterium sp. WL2]
MNPNRPLKGLTILALEQAVAAPYCTSRLADAGARVIKIERREGDFARGYDSAVNGLASYFVWLNRGKESLVADIKDPDDVRLLHAILEDADVFVQNLAPGAAARAGFGSAELRARYPRLITVDISGYGAGHAYSDMKAYDLLVQAESGMAGITGHPAGPGRVGVSVCDIACGMDAHAAVLEALIARSISDVGCALEVSLFSGAADWMTVPLLYFEGTDREPLRVGLAHPTISPYGAYPTADGSLVLISIQNEREWARFCEGVLGEPDLARAEGYASNNARVANRAAVDLRIAAILVRLSRDAAATRLKAAGTAYGFVNTLADLATHPALVRAEVETPAGPARIVAPPVLIDGEVRALGRVPDIGEHSERIRREFGVER